MSSGQTNPFHDVFVTDSAPAEDFVRYFSPFLVPHLPELFQQGNVVLKGTQGCGKSMLLKLFQPEIRTAYFDRNKVLQRAGGALDYPVPETQRGFVSAGVNLSKSGLLDVVQLIPEKPSDAEYQEMTALFSDFLNYWLLRDLLHSLRIMTGRVDVFGNLVNSNAFDDFVQVVSAQDCWFGYLVGCKTFDDLQSKVTKRIRHYRSWTARNSDLPGEVSTSKTAIAVPLSATADALKKVGVIRRNVVVFLRIDQMEELWHRDGPQETQTSYLRHAINRAIGSRDLRVSFRVGTRRYAWSGNLALPGGRQIEESRDFDVIDLDKRLRRGEDRSGWLFEGFAADVFQHRISANTEESRPPLSQLQMHRFFGASPTPHQLIERLIVSPPEDPQKLLKLDQGWSEEWQQFILDVYRKTINRSKPKVSEAYSKNPVDALLMAAWGLQTGGVSVKEQRRAGPPPRHFPPWTSWWEKERLMVVTMQLTVRHQQTLFWWGTKKVLALSASNITIFLSICREVWDQWRRRTVGDDDQAQVKKAVSWKTQAVAIDSVSKNWHRNFARQPGRPSGDIRIRFVDELGSWLRRKLLADNSLSYPGGNGFSLRHSDVKLYEPLKRLLEEAVGWGDLYEVDHTTKIPREKHIDPRKKYYLNPILSPHFQIPEAHTKEPLYAHVDEILKLACKARACIDSQADLKFD